MILKKNSIATVYQDGVTPSLGSKRITRNIEVIFTDRSMLLGVIWVRWKNYELCVLESDIEI